MKSTLKTIAIAAMLAANAESMASGGKLVSKINTFTTLSKAEVVQGKIADLKPGRKGHNMQVTCQDDGAFAIDTASGTNASTVAFDAKIKNNQEAVIKINNVIMDKTKNPKLWIALLLGVRNKTHAYCFNLKPGLTHVARHKPKNSCTSSLPSAASSRV